MYTHFENGTMQKDISVALTKDVPTCIILAYWYNPLGASNSFPVGTKLTGAEISMEECNCYYKVYNINKLVNTIIDFLDIIRRPVYYLNKNRTKDYVQKVNNCVSITTASNCYISNSLILTTFLFICSICRSTITQRSTC
jgi:hypothetical protein